MSERTRIETTRLAVIDSNGARTYLTVSTPVVTGTYMDGETYTHKKLASITNARGVHVNRKADTEFESIDGEKYRLAP